LRREPALHVTILLTASKFHTDLKIAIPGEDLADHFFASERFPHIVLTP
jgi:hypothetical protein